MPIKSDSDVIFCLQLKKQKSERKEIAIAGISVSDITDTFSKSVNFDEAHRGVETVVDIFVVAGGGGDGS